MPSGRRGLDRPAPPGRRSRLLRPPGRARRLPALSRRVPPAWPISTRFT